MTRHTNFMNDLYGRVKKHHKSVHYKNPVYGDRARNFWNKSNRRPEYKLWKNMKKEYDPQNTARNMHNVFTMYPLHNHRVARKQRGFSYRNSIDAPWSSLWKANTGPVWEYGHPRRMFIDHGKSDSSDRLMFKNGFPTRWYTQSLDERTWDMKEGKRGREHLPLNDYRAWNIGIRNKIRNKVIRKYARRPYKKIPGRFSDPDNRRKNRKYSNMLYNILNSNK
nr:hypothetical protein [Crucivirus sp.]